MTDEWDYKIIRREVAKPDGSSSVVFYDIAVITPTGAQSVWMHKSYQTEAEAQTEIDRLREL